MAEVVLFHHAQGRTSGVEGFAARLKAAGHRVHVPDLYDGQLFEDLEAGVGYAQAVGFDTIVEKGVAAAEGLPSEVVYAGFSLGVMPAQRLAQTQPLARGALLFEACAPPSTFGGPWPGQVPIQIHGMDEDEFFAGDGDLDAARSIVASSNKAELFLYPGDRHLFADDSLPAYEPVAADLLLQRVTGFLDAII
ncbi:MAG: dienelactone hydrolase [Actinomycetia bacterium]|nr:dienelactone hydrolase [Actinomycetes bacterium]